MKISLYTKLLKELPEKVNLSEKLIELADGIRKAGNFGAHFDENVVPDQELWASLTLPASAGIATLCPNHRLAPSLGIE